MTKKERFKLMYDRLTTVKKGVHLNKVLCSSLMYTADGKINALGGIKSLTKFILSFDTSQLSKEPIDSILVIFGYYPTRKDHRELMEGVAKRIGNSCTFIDTSKWSTRHLTVSPANIWRGIKDGFWGMKGTGLSLKQRLLLGANISFYLNTLDSLSKRDFSRTSKFLCLANSLDLENLVTQYMQSLGIKTYSLMEGAYFIQDNEDTITNIAFSNLTSDIQLCWGEFSKDEFTNYGYSADQLKVIGYPKDVKQILMKNKNPFKKGIVLLSQYLLDSQNRELVEILSHYTNNMDFCLKLHPSLDFEYYSHLAKEKGMSIIPKDITINQCIDNRVYDFAVAINSTAYYEALMRGLPCLRYYDGSYTKLSGYDDEFSDETTFGEQINRIKNLSLQDYQLDIDATLKYAVGFGIDEYHFIMVEDK